MWHLYFIYSVSTNKYYTGISEDPWKRVKDYNDERNKKSTAPGRPWIAKGFWEISESEAEALRVERFVKKQKSRKFIERMLEDEPLYGILARLVRVPQFQSRDL